MSQFFKANQLIQIPNGDYIIAGILNDAGTRRISVATLDKTLKLRKTYQLPVPVNQEIGNPGIIYTGGRVAIIHTTAIGNSMNKKTKHVYAINLNDGRKVWEWKHESPVNSGYQGRAVMDDVGFVYIPGWINEPGTSDDNIRLQTIDKFAPDGTRVWQRVFRAEEGSSENLSYLEALSGGTLLGAGSARTATNQLRPWIFITDANGCLSPDCDELDEVFASNEAPLKIAVTPNPAVNSITLLTLENLANVVLPDVLQNTKLNIRNASGQIVKSFTLNQGVTGQQSPLDISGLPSGMYLAQIESNDGKLLSNIVKFVKQ